MVVMRRWTLMMPLAVLLLAAQVGAAETPVLKTQLEKESYAVGVDLARNVKRQGVTLDAEALAKGMKDGLSGAKLIMTEEDIRGALNTFQVDMKQRRARTTRVVAEDNKKEGQAFLAANKEKEGVVTLPSGLQYKVLRESSGGKPTDGDTVVVNYRGTLIDGTEFDNTYRLEQPLTLKVAGVIPGWKEALKLMPVGSKWQLFIPDELAYGEKGSGRKIGPNETLIFDVELVAIK